MGSLKEMNRKGDMLTPAQLVIIILSVLGLVIAIIVIVNLNMTDEAGEKACTLSLLTRAGIGSILPSPLQSATPLRCTTKKICITDSVKHECSQFKGEKDVKYEIVDIKKSSAEAARTIEQINVESMYNCWKLMGQGKMDIFPGTGSDSIFTGFLFQEIVSITPSCFICDRISISDGLLKSEYVVNKVKTPYYPEVVKLMDVEKYAETHYPEGSKQTYVQVFTNDELRVYPSGLKDKKVWDNTGIVFMQIITKMGALDAIKMAGIKDVAALAAVPKPGAKVLPGVVAKVAAYIAIVAVLTHATVSAVVQVDNQRTSAVVCGDLTGNREGGMRQGCSVAMRVNYDKVDEINKACGIIEGNP